MALLQENQIATAETPFRRQTTNSSFISVEKNPGATSLTRS